jgi:hypothetical protein
MPDIPTVPASGDPMQLLQGLPVTSSLYSAAGNVLSARQARAQAETKLNTLEQDNATTADQLTQARNDLLQKNREATEAELRLTEAKQSATDKSIKQMDSATGKLGDIGAALDQDFGISKGLGGIVENLTRFIGNIAAAPYLGQLKAIADVTGATQQGGYGMTGVAAAQGKFGEQYTPAAYFASQQQTGAQGYAMSSNPNANAMMSLAQQSSGNVKYAPASDLVHGLADCSGSISDLVEVLQTGTTTPGRLFDTTDFGSDAQAAKLGFQPGYQPGALNVGVNPNPGQSGHMAATLPNGVNFEGGGGTGGGAQYGGSASGALDPQFQRHYYMPVGPTVPDPYSPAITSPVPTDPATWGPGGIPALPGAGGQGYGIGTTPGMVGQGATAPTAPVGGPGPAGWQPSGSGAGADGGLIGSAAGAAASALDVVAPGTGQAAQTATKLINRGIQFGGQLAGIGVNGLIDTFSLSDDTGLGNLQQSWFGRLAAGFAGAKPALPTSAGQTQTPAKQVDPNTTEHGTGGGQPPGPTVHIENFSPQDGQSGQSIANEIAFRSYQQGKR